MKNENLVRSYDHISPDDRAKERMLANILNRNTLSISADDEWACMKGRRIKQSLITVLICLAILLCTALVGYTIYQKWFLPKPETYEPGSNGIHDVYSQNDYTEDTLPTADPSTDGAEPPNSETLTDSFFIAKAAEILEQIGLDDVDTSAMTVKRQNHLLYDREEVEVLFTKDENNTSAIFHAATGDLISLSSIDWIEVPDIVCKTEKEAAAKATEYYGLLPVPQGYVMTHSQRYDEQYWTFYFDREVRDGLFSEYEQVRIGINPKNGRLTGCNVFYFPLLDDHGEGDEPLTQTEAGQIARQRINELWPGSTYELAGAEIAVVLPNWRFTEYEGGYLRYSDITRLAWRATYKNPNSRFADQFYMDIDLYTGEILGGDGTK